MRATIHQLLTAQSDLTDIVPADRWWQPGNVIDRPTLPFVVLRWLAPVPLAASRFAKQLRIDVHEPRGSYARGRALLGSPDLGSGVYGVLSGLQDYVGTDGRISQADYLGHSGDLENDSYSSNYQFQSWQMIGVDL